MTMIKKVDPYGISADLLPSDRNVWEAISNGMFSIVQDEEGKYLVCESEEEFDPFYVQLEHAFIYKFDNLILTDKRGVPTKEDCKRFPAMFSRNVMRSYDRLNARDECNQLRQALLAFEEEDICNFPDDLKEALLEAEKLHKSANLIFDRRYKNMLSDLVKQINKYSFYEDNKFYYRVMHYVKNANILLSWYEKPKLYVIKQVTYEGSSVADRYTNVGSNHYRAMVELSRTFLWERNYHVDVFKWEFYENDTLLREVLRDNWYQDLADLFNQNDKLLSSKEEADWLI